MWTRRAIGGLIAAAVAPTTVIGQQRAAGNPSPRRQEVESLQRFAEATHPDGARAAADPKWRRLASDFARSADSLGDGGYIVGLMRLLAYFADGHTSLIFYEYARGPWGPRLAVKCNVFHDGLYVTAAKEEAAPLLGARVVRIAGVETEELIRRLAAVWPAANPAWPHRWSPALLRTPGFLHGLGVLEGPDDAPVAIDASFLDGRTVYASLKPRPGAQIDRTPVARVATSLEIYAATRSRGAQADPTEDGGNFVWARDGGRVLYVSLDRMDTDDFGKPFADFERELATAMAAPAAKRLIIDLRRNGGGDNTLCEPLRHQIGRTRFNRPGGLYVLIGPQTFSAAQNLATRLERETFAVFVGEPTGLRPNHFGDAQSFKAIASGAPIYVSTLRWQDMPPQDERRWIMPDLPAPSRFADWMAGRDIALDIALSHAPGGEGDDRTLTAPWTRASQTQEWKPFWL